MGPGEPAFRALVVGAQHRLRPQLFQGGTLSDPTTSTGYDIACYEAEVSEGKRRTIWLFLVRVDDTGARVIRWESLANLAPSGEPGRALHPARAADADAVAREAACAQQADRTNALAEWLAAARHDLERLPDALTSDIADSAKRGAERRRLEAAVADNLADLQQMATVHVGEVRRIGWSHVTPAGPPPDPAEKDSEDISMRLVARTLRAGGWGVADVHAEDRGYDLLAIKGRRQLCIEVKGVWHSASASGVVLTGNELLIAGQMGRDYWLWVVDRCSDGTGKTFGVYADPGGRVRRAHQGSDAGPRARQRPQGGKTGGSARMRMIERWFPCQEVSDASAAGWGTGNAEANIFTWFAKRPLAQAKAAVITSLLPWPDDPAEQRRLQDLVRRSLVGSGDAKKAGV